MKKLFILTLLISFIIAAAYFFSHQKNFPSPLPTITINNHKIFIEIADTPEKRSIGLSNRESLPQNQGMLFVFGNEGYYRFWMKETLIPLDFVWIKDSQVVETTSNVQPEDYQPPKTLSPQQPVDQVLELNAGTISKLGITPGNDIILK